MKRAISVSDVDNALWKRFTGLAKMQGLLVVQALSQAVALWIQVNRNKMNKEA